MHITARENKRLNRIESQSKIRLRYADVREKNACADSIIYSRQAGHYAEGARYQVVTF